MHQGNFRVFGTESTGLCIYLKFSSVSTFQGTGVTIPVCLVLKAPFLVLFKDIDVFLHSHVSPALALRSLCWFCPQVRRHCRLALPYGT